MKESLFETMKTYYFKQYLERFIIFKCIMLHKQIQFIL